MGSFYLYLKPGCLILSLFFKKSDYNYYWTFKNHFISSPLFKHQNVTKTMFSSIIPAQQPESFTETYQNS